MKRIWPFVYLAIFAMSFWGGTRPFDASHTNIDWIAISIAFVLFGIFPLLAVEHACKRWVQEPPRWSVFRGFKGLWWTDPLQCLFLTTVLMAGHSLGSLLTLPHDDAKQTLIVWCNAAILFGFLVGDFAVWVRFRSSIN